MRPPTVYKQVGEARVMTFDFGSKMNTSDTVTAVVGGALDSPVGITVSAPTITGNKVSALISGGSITNTPYRISCRVTTSQGETLELDVNVRVADGVN